MSAIAESDASLGSRLGVGSSAFSTRTVDFAGYAAAVEEGGGGGAVGVLVRPRVEGLGASGNGGNVGGNTSDYNENEDHVNGNSIDNVGDNSSNNNITSTNNSRNNSSHNNNNTTTTTTTTISDNGGRVERADLQSGSGCGGDNGGAPEGAPRRMGPALTSEAAGLSDLIRRRGGLTALSDARTVAAVLRAAAPRRQSSFHPPRPRGFFEMEADSTSAAAEAVAVVGIGMVLVVAVVVSVEGRAIPRDPVWTGGAGVRADRVVAVSQREGGGGGEEEPAGSASMYVSTTCSFFGSAKSPEVEAMVPFAVRHPYPASERRRLRTATCVFFSITAGGNSDVLDVFGFSNTGRGSGGGGGNRDGGGGGVRGDGGGGNWGGVVRRGVSSSRHEQGKRRSNREGGGGVEVQGGRAADRPVSKTEEQLYAVLGALLEAAKELLPGARDGGAAVNAVGETAVLTLKGACALNRDSHSPRKGGTKKSTSAPAPFLLLRVVVLPPLWEIRAPSTSDTSFARIPRRTSMCQHAVCAPRSGRKTLENGARYEDGVVLVPDCRKLRQEIVRSTCMDPMGSIRPDYHAYVGAPIFVDGAPLGTFCVYLRRTLKDVGWGTHHTAILRGLGDAASTEMTRLCRMAELDYAQRHRHILTEPHQLKPRRPTSSLLGVKTGGHALSNGEAYPPTEVQARCVGRAASNDVCLGARRGCDRGSLLAEGGRVCLGSDPESFLGAREAVAGGAGLGIRAVAGEGEEAVEVAAAATSSGSQQEGTTKGWRRALRKLSLRRRRKSKGGRGSDEGDNGSSSSLDASRRRAGGTPPHPQVFVERSRAW
eukprot:jgi/Undpi1/12640/HiC_scaffold_6.g02308.m1